MVADEVRKLAKRTTQSTVEVAAHIDTIQGQSVKAIAAMEAADARTSRGADLASQSEGALLHLASGSAENVRHMTEIAATLKEQDAAVRDIAASIERISQTTEENDAAARRNHEVASDLERLSGKLREMTQQFRVEVARA